MKWIIQAVVLAVVSSSPSSAINPSIVSRRGLFKKPQEIAYGPGKVDADELKRRLAEFLAQMHDVIGALPAALGKYSLDSVELTVEVTATGKVSLLGTGVEVAGKGGITFRLNRAE